MLDGAGNDVPAGLSGAAHGAEDRQIVSFRPAAGEDDLGRVGVDQGGYLAARGLQALLRRLSEVVNARRVTIRLTEASGQRVEDFGRDWGGGVVIEVKMLHLILF